LRLRSGVADFVYIPVTEFPGRPDPVFFGRIAPRPPESWGVEDAHGTLELLCCARAAALLGIGYGTGAYLM
jgi:hypothetical protein